MRRRTMMNEVVLPSWAQNGRANTELFEYCWSRTGTDPACMGPRNPPPPIRTHMVHMVHVLNWYSEGSLCEWVCVRVRTSG